jgi:hypothetical protein
MTEQRTFGRRWESLARPHAKIFVVAAIAISAVDQAFATGFYGLNNYLDRGGKNVDGSPEFYWELEVKRLAKDFKAPEKLALPLANPDRSGEESAGPDRNKATADADVNDFKAAIKEQRIKPTDAAKALQQHTDARGLIEATAASLSEEFESEFSDYHKGALAFRLGKEHWAEARQAWENLLKRPADQRHYRTVWATFMLGKIALKSEEPDAAKWFQQTRDLAKAGFADSLGMAADSYGWEGRSEWKQNHPEKAAALFLTQLALGDESAIVSLKALVPDRAPIEGMLNYGPEADERNAWSDQQKRDEEQKTSAALKAAAKDPLLRRLVTAHILSTESSHDLYSDDSETPRVNRCARWLSVIKAANVGKVDDAEYLGWVAYNNGDYKGAAHWLELGKKDTPAGYWLQAKLQRRAGKLDDALKSMDHAWQSIHETRLYTGWTGFYEEPSDEENSYMSGSEGPSWSFAESASGDLAALHLVHTDFVEAMDKFLNGDLWYDAAFVAERVLTTDELKKYVDGQSAAPSESDANIEGPINKLRYLLGRRLAREKRYAEAGRYLKPPYNKVLEKYAGALKDGATEKLPKMERAKAYFTAAWLARYDGMEFMGTEVAPDVFASEGSFEIADLADERKTGVYKMVVYQKGEEKKVSHPVVLKASKSEVQRLTKNKVSPDVRFHYRLVAGELAIRAAQLLPDNSEELADVVNRAGLWVKDRDEKIGNGYYTILEKRASQTKIGRAANVKHWFVDDVGPWSQQQQEASDARDKELKEKTPED